MTQVFKLRCRRCRQVLLTDVDIVNTHGSTLNEKSCSNPSTDSVWYVSVDAELPWIQESIDNASWTKGKLSCPKCKGRIGSFDFVSSMHCPCHRHALPGVHILRDRVDQIKPPSGAVATDKPFRNMENLQMVYASYNPRDISSSIFNHVDEIKKPTEIGDTLPDMDILENIENIPCNSTTVCVVPPINDDRLSRCDNVRGTCMNNHPSVGDHGCTDSTANQKPSDTGIERPATRLSKRIRRRRRRTSNDLHLCEKELQAQVNRFGILTDEEISSGEEIQEDISDEHICAVCLDVYLQPHECQPCAHVFCETCLRQLAAKSDNSTSFPCPLCRELIRNCQLHQDLIRTLKLLYPESYRYRLMTDRKYLSHRFPLPKSRGRQLLSARQPMVNPFYIDTLFHFSRLTIRGITFLGAVVFVLLVLCVSLAL